MQLHSHHSPNILLAITPPLATLRMYETVRASHGNFTKVFIYSIIQGSEDPVYEPDGDNDHKLKAIRLFVSANHLTSDCFAGQCKAKFASKLKLKGGWRPTSNLESASFVALLLILVSLWNLVLVCPVANVASSI